MMSAILSQTMNGARTGSSSVSFLAVFLLSCASWIMADAVFAQRSDIVELKSGSRISGQVELTEDRVVINRKSGSGTVRYNLPFDRIAPHSMFSLLISHLAPFDKNDHRRLADAAFNAKLYFTAAKHYRASAYDPKSISRELFERIDSSEKKDLESMLGRSAKAMEREDFRRSRRIALSAMKRYAHRPKEEVAKAEAQLEAITKQMATAKARDAAFARSKKAKAALKSHLRALATVETALDRARLAESKGLRQSRKLRRAKNYYESSLRRIHTAGRQAERLRRDKALPVSLQQRLAELEEEIVSADIRVRLHIASLYTFRGSYGSAIGYVNEALAIDPTDRQALAARSNIEQAAAAASAPGGFLR